MNGSNDVEDLYFLPTEVSATGITAKGAVKKIKDKVPNLRELAGMICEQANGSGAVAWEVSVEGSLEVGTGLWPGGKAGFKATLKLSNKE